MVAVILLAGVVAAALVLLGTAMLVGRMMVDRRPSAHQALMFAVLDRLVSDEAPVEVPGLDGRPGMHTSRGAA
jgi:hypothetical protein